MTDLTAANAVITLTLPPLFVNPVQIQHFGTNDITDIDAIGSAELKMGVDGRLSGGFVYNPAVQHFTLMADSDSISFFDQWFAYQIANRVTLNAQGSITLKSVGKKFILTRGFLGDYKPLPDVKRVLEEQRFNITWQSCFAQPSGV